MSYRHMCFGMDMSLLKERFNLSHILFNILHRLLAYVKLLHTCIKSKVILQYHFAGRYDLVKFVNLVGKAGLMLHLRIGPYACAEWNFG